MSKVKTARKKLLRLFLIGFVILFLMLSIQSYLGKYGDIVFWVWLWFLILYLPPIVVLLKTKNTSFKVNFNALRTLSILFVVSTIIVIFMMPFVALENIEVLKTSFYFLFLLGLILIYFIWYQGIEPPPPDPIVFISYNHQDAIIALKIKEALDAAKIEVIMDIDNMTAGTMIEKFIKKSIKASNVTVSVVSNASLGSAWVGSETVDTLLLQTFYSDRKFIACYLDDDFLTQNDYTQKAIAKIDIKIKELDALIQEAHSSGRNTRDLDSKRTRLVHLKNNMDLIIARLQNSLCLHVNQSSFNSSMKRLIQRIETNA